MTNTYGRFVFLPTFWTLLGFCFAIPSTIDIKILSKPRELRRLHICLVTRGTNKEVDYSLKGRQAWTYVNSKTGCGPICWRDAPSAAARFQSQVLCCYRLPTRTIILQPRSQHHQYTSHISTSQSNIQSTSAGVVSPSSTTSWWWLGSTSWWRNSCGRACYRSLHTICWNRDFFWFWPSKLS